MRTYYKNINESGVAWKESTNQVIEDMGGKEKAFKIQEEKMSEISRYYKGKLAFLSPQLKNETKNILVDIAKKREDTHLFDKVSSFYNKENKLPDHHPTARGYRIMAEEIFGYLKNSKLIPCN